jgi:hypothetical protein
MPNFGITKEAYGQRLFRITCFLTIVNEKYIFMFCYVNLRDFCMENNVKICIS